MPYLADQWFFYFAQLYGCIRGVHCNKRGTSEVAGTSSRRGGGGGWLGGIVYAPLALLRHWDHRILQRGLLNKLVLVFSTANFCAVL